MTNSPWSIIGLAVAGSTQAAADAQQAGPQLTAMVAIANAVAACVVAVVHILDKRAESRERRARSKDGATHK